jgi:DNA-binding transcriptional ArsR family regulator
MADDERTPGMSTLRATAHPLRLRMLSLLTGADMSAAEVARELDITQANASYHLRVLAEAELIVDAGEQKIRGGIAKRYRHPWDSPGRAGKPAPEDPELYVRVVAEELVRRFRARTRGKQLLSDAEMWVTPEVWKEIVDLVQQASSLIHGEAQPPRTPGTIHVNLTAAVFEMTDPKDEGR